MNSRDDVYGLKFVVTWSRGPIPPRPLNVATLGITWHVLPQSTDVIGRMLGAITPERA